MDSGVSIEGDDTRAGVLSPGRSLTGIDGSSLMLRSYSSSDEYSAEEGVPPSPRAADEDTVGGARVWVESRGGSFRLDYETGLIGDACYDW